MGEPCDLKHLVKEEGSGASLKVEGLSKAALMKSLSPRVVLSNHLLPKGSKMKVNLEDQGRQKVSFSFTQTKKSRQSLFFIPSSPDKSVTEPQTKEDKGGHGRCNSEQKQSCTVQESIAESHSQAPVPSATKHKPDLTKIHFKKQLISVSAAEEQPISVMVEEEHSSDFQDAQKSSVQNATELSTPQPPSVSSTESSAFEGTDAWITPTVKQSAASTVKDGETSSSTESVNKACKMKTRSQSDSAPICSESEGDSAQMSSSQKAADSKGKSNLDSKSKDVKKSSSGPHGEEKDKTSFKRSENHERSSSYSKSDRDSRHTSSRSSRSDKDRRRSRSRSRSRSRGARTSSSHSRSERSRGDRGSRSERSYYHESDWRSHRSSPRRERRRSRSRTDRTRDSSDSEDDHRKTKTRTSVTTRSSAYSNSHRESKSSSFSKCEKVSKSVGSPHASEMDKKTQLTKAERTSKRPDSDLPWKCSPDLDPNHHRSNTHYKSETNRKSSSSSLHTRSQSYEKRHKSSSSESETDQKGRSQSSDKSAGSEENNDKSVQKSGEPDLNQVATSVKNTEENGQMDHIFPNQASSCTTTDKLSQSEEESPPNQDTEEQYVKQVVPFVEKALEESLSEVTYVNNSSLKDENRNTSPISQSENLKHENATPGNLSNVKDSISSNNQPYVNLNATVLIACSNDSIMNNCSLEPKSIPDRAEMAVTNEVQENTKVETDEQNQVLTVEQQSTSALPSKSDSACLETENQLICGQESVNLGKKPISTAKKSRWDIVGQDFSEFDNSQKTPSAENKPTTKKVISIKEVEFSKEKSQQHFKDNVQESEAHSTIVKQTELFKQEAGTDRITHQYKDQSELSQPSTSINHCDLQLFVSEKTNVNGPVHIGDALQVDIAAKIQSWNKQDHEEESKDSSKTKMRKRASPNEDALGGQSEVSDSDNSEYDSDCDEAIKRLHSVVVVPKNSSLTVEMQNTGASCSPMANSDHHSAYTASDVNIRKVINQGNPEQRRSSAAFGGNSGSCVDLNESPRRSMLCQSQSNMIDSTSHLEGSSSISALPGPGHINASRNTPDPAYSFDSSKQMYSQHAVNSRGEQIHFLYQQEGFSCAGNFGDKGHFNFWDFSQSEQPSSTYQQPDSSHGPQLLNTKLSETSVKGQEHGQDCASLNHHSPNTQTSRKPYLHSDEHCQDMTEIHPDSLTNDHDDYSSDKQTNLNPSFECSGLNTPGSSSFVQGHEISSNSRGSVVPEPPSVDHYRPQRGRGPPKKRRHEVESDSDNEAEAGPTSKRERQGDTDTSKETFAKAGVHHPSLTLQEFQDASKWKELAKSKKMPPYFDLIEENLYLTERKKSKSHRDIKRMQCECPVLPREDRARGVLACGEDCLNRLLMIECSSRCLNGAYCSNRRFQMKQHADFDVILTEEKGWGLRAAKDLASNTFVLEYCGEVLDHKEFKTRVKEYARNKNIHYYFMSLKNNEIIDATLKGNCSRFMNHSCEPNCETQKWTVNGQLRVGFFTTKAVSAGTELTFDYQFQRYGKEAQKCFCGAPSCRGFLGGENRVSVRAAGGKMKKDRSRKSALTTVDEELEALLENGEGLYDEKQVVSLCRLMVRVETMQQKLICLKLIQDTQNPSCLKQFLDHHGLSLLWIFMVEISEAKGNSANNTKLQLEIMKTLAVLPISTKNMLEESRVLTFIQRWAQTKALPQPAEMDGYSSENTSRAQTPLNTPDGSSTKLGQELEGDASKPAVFRRLKIISENSLDSALSDASKASDCKEEEEDEEEDDEDEESSHVGLLDSKQLKEEQNGEDGDLAKETTADSVKEEKVESQEDADIGSSCQHQVEIEDAEVKMEIDLEKGEIELKREVLKKELESKEAENGNEQPSQTETEKHELADDQPSVDCPEKTESECNQSETEPISAESKPMQAEAGPMQAEAGPMQAEAGPMQAEAGPMQAEAGPMQAEAGPMQVEPGVVQTEPGIIQAEVEVVQTEPGIVQAASGVVQTEPGIIQAEAGVVQTEPGIIQAEAGVVQTEPEIIQAEAGVVQTEPGIIQAEAEPNEKDSESIQINASDLPPELPSEQNKAQLETQEPEKTSPDCEVQPGESTTDAAPCSEIPEASIHSEVLAVQVDPSVIGTPSQDEEGVSDVESERSQEPQFSALDISGMAARLLESWKDLKEVYRIPKKSQVEKEANDRSRERDMGLLPRATSGSRERERERDKDRDRDYDRDWDRDRDRLSDKATRSTERRRRRSLSPPSLSYERSSRRTDERFDPSNSNKTPRGVGGKERNKLSTEERRKLFEQEVAQREAQKQQQLQQQQLQTMAYNPALAYTSSPGFITYPPGYPIQTFVDPSNPNAGKVLLPTPSVEPTLNYEQTASQHLITDLGLPSPSSTPQATPVSNLSQHITTANLATGTPQQYAQPSVSTQDASVAVLSVPAPQVQGQQSYTTLWDPNTQQAVTVQTQPAQQYATTPAQAQTQTAIYYQGQPCQTIYSIPTAYPQTSAPVIQAYTEPTASYLHGQPVYPSHQQGVVVQQGGTVTTIVTSQTVQQEMIVPNNVIDLPPPSPPKPKTIILPPNWKVARDPEGKIYYYHIVTRQTQWDPPTWDGSSDNTSVDHESEMDLGTPTYDENPSKFSTKTAEADTSSELAKRSKETFRKEMSQFIVQCLNPYRKPDCKSGRISNTEDFKHLARKLTHGVMNKELKACKNPEDLECNENVKHKTKEYIKKYMQRFGSVYRPKEDTEVC
ncbi:histone-lysine N-methyltransferase SETD2 isoform X2 [Betta splendens]|uniref:[histone H3]-lysine(36) N-trimethyltransferase n=1 Tax=Betta splendens TaxID=158456 RepID=A0A6P7KXP3_BETSP|nr:histone-lysine N-methyltransferase SETD2 isoform X2 [Betta splendens]